MVSEKRATVYSREVISNIVINVDVVGEVMKSLYTKHVNSGRVDSALTVSKFIEKLGQFSMFVKSHGIQYKDGRYVVIDRFNHFYNKTFIELELSYIEMIEIIDELVNHGIDLREGFNINDFVQ